MMTRLGPSRDGAALLLGMDGDHLPVWHGQLISNSLPSGSFIPTA